jgi:hypothetical protein
LSWVGEGKGEGKEEEVLKASKEIQPQEARSEIASVDARNGDRNKIDMRPYCQLLSTGVSGQCQPRCTNLTMQIDASRLGKGSSDLEWSII